MPINERSNATSRKQTCGKSASNEKKKLKCKNKTYDRVILDQSKIGGILLLLLILIKFCYFWKICWQ